MGRALGTIPLWHGTTSAFHGDNTKIFGTARTLRDGKHVWCALGCETQPALFLYLAFGSSATGG